MNINNKIDKIMNNKKFIWSTIGIFIFILVITVYLSVSPRDFPTKKIISVREGTSLSSVAETLEQASIIRSIFIYKVFVVLLGGRNKIIAGDYLFDKPQSALRIAYRTVNGNLGQPQIKVTLPEGIASYDIARLIAKKFKSFDSKTFLSLAKKEEGYLFPDTYYLYESMSPEQIVTMMKNNFEKKTAKLVISAEIKGRTFDDIIKMASIVEREATTTSDRRMIAGVLWKRFDSDFPLQVDPPFFYTLGKTSLSLTMSDLTSDSPYNLYNHKGLPPTPIGNPGLNAIYDTLNPIDSDFWFYLSDRRGVTHYAVTHEGHLANRDKYLQ